jgi:hypothetical protein
MALTTVLQAIAIVITGGLIASAIMFVAAACTNKPPRNRLTETQ